MALAFATVLGLPAPEAFAGDTTYVRRWASDPSAALAAEANGRLIGLNFVSRWGSFGFFGPLAVRPECWNQGVAQQLLEATVEIFQRWGVRHAGLCTFPDSPKHLALYGKFGFVPRFLTPIMAKAVARPPRPEAWVAYSAATQRERESYRAACRELTDEIYPGLDLSTEINAVYDQRLGETVLLPGEGRLDGFAVCHHGPGTEAGSGVCYVKFGAARMGAGAEHAFRRLLNTCETLAAERGLARLTAGVNTGRLEAYRVMQSAGFRTTSVVVLMEWPDDLGFNRRDVYVLDDWR